MNPSPEARQVMREYAWEQNQEKKLRRIELGCYLALAVWLVFMWWCFK